MNTMKCAILIFLALLFIAPQSMATNSAVFIMYHRFGENNYPSTNVRLAQLENHIRELKSGPYTVLPVLQILSYNENGRAQPKRIVGITIDDGFESIPKPGRVLEKLNYPLRFLFQQIQSMKIVQIASTGTKSGKCAQQV